MEENKVIDVTPEAVVEPKYLNFEVERGARKYIFCIPDGSPIGETYDVAHLILQRLTDLAAEATKNLARPDAAPEAVVVSGEENAIQ
jgi:hypothetical protein